MKDKLIFYGYPRSLSQAKYLDLLLNETNQKISYIFFLNVNKETIIKRIEKRKSIENRSDDELTTILARYDSYIEINSCSDYAEKLEQDMEMDAPRTGINACSLPLQDSVCGIRLD